MTQLVDVFALEAKFWEFESPSEHKAFVTYRCMCLPEEEKILVQLQTKAPSPRVEMDIITSFELVVRGSNPLEDTGL